jgi:hypothetical protein
VSHSSRQQQNSNQSNNESNHALRFFLRRLLLMLLAKVTNIITYHNYKEDLCAKRAGDNAEHPMTRFIDSVFPLEYRQYSTTLFSYSIETYNNIDREIYNSTL